MLKNKDCWCNIDVYKRQVWSSSFSTLGLKSGYWQGPFPDTNDGNGYIMVTDYYFPKWLEAYAFPNQEVTTVLKTLVYNFCCRYGVPMEMHMDQGRNFESEEIREAVNTHNMHRMHYLYYSVHCESKYGHSSSKNRNPLCDVMKIG